MSETSDERELFEVCANEAFGEAARLFPESVEAIAFLYRAMGLSREWSDMTDTHAWAKSVAPKHGYWREPLPAPVQEL